MHDDDPSEEKNADDQRGETPLQRLDRNWGDLLQELRVSQTGVQLLTGFLLTLPFQARFDELTPSARTVYLATLAASVVAMGFLIAPVSLHRLLFRRHARRETVDIAHRLAQTGLAFLALAVVGVVLLIFEVVAGGPAAAVATVLTAALLAGLWVVLPLVVRSRHSGD